MALYVLATGVTDPDKLCADLKLRSRITAESALAYWAGAGLLERYDENAAPGGGEPAPTPMRWTEIAAASRTDPMIASLIDCAQTTFARALTHSEMEKLVALYLQEGFEPETVMLCLALPGRQGQADHGRFEPRAQSLAGRRRRDRRGGGRPPQTAGPAGKAGGLCGQPAGDRARRPDPGRQKGHRPLV